jgi:hypothetical protein
LEHLKSVAPKVADKVQRDATMTTGAPWKSDEAGPNRILRYAMLLSDAELEEFGVPLSGVEAHVVQKLRAKAAPYDDCIRVSEFLTLQVYEMPEAPDCPSQIKVFLLEHPRGAAITPDSPSHARSGSGNVRLRDVRQAKDHSCLVSVPTPECESVVEQRSCADIDDVARGTLCAENRRASNRPAKKKKGS